MLDCLCAKMFTCISADLIPTWKINCTIYIFYPNLFNYYIRDFRDVIAYQIKTDLQICSRYNAVLLYVESQHTTC